MAKKINNKSFKEDRFILQLYVSGMSPRSMEAIENIKRICKEYIKNMFDLEIIDIYKNPEVATKEQIVFSPSLIRRSPLPRKILVGNFSDRKKVLRILGISFKE